MRLHIMPQFVCLFLKIYCYFHLCVSVWHMYGRLWKPELMRALDLLEMSLTGCCELSGIVVGN